MIKTIKLGVYFFLFLSLLPLQLKAITEKEENILNSTINLMCVDVANQNSMMGTALVIDKSGYILTNKHVIEDSDYCVVYYPIALNQSFALSPKDPANLIAISNSHDLALLKIENYRRNYYVNIMSNSGIRDLNEEAFYYGYPSKQFGSEEETYLLSRGSGSIIDVNDDDIIVSIQSERGASGSGVFYSNGDYLGSLHSVSSDRKLIQAVNARQAIDFVLQLVETGYMKSYTYSDVFDDAYYLLSENQALARSVRGRILLEVEKNGEAWYVDTLSLLRYYLGRPHDAFNVMRERGVGITNNDLNKIPISLDYLSGLDSDGDGLPDAFEKAIGSNYLQADSDGDGFNDYVEILNSYNPLGEGRLTFDDDFSKRNAGRIFLQVEKNGEAWYINPVNSMRYFLSRPEDAFAIMRQLGLGISNENIKKIKAD